MRVLIIEDDPVIAANLYEYLAAAGYEPEHAPDGVLGLHRAVHERWAAIVLDLALPGMNGLDLCSKLRNEARLDTPVLIVTARDSLQDKLRGFSHGADDYLVKPFSLKEAAARLQALIKRDRRQVVPAMLVWQDIRLDAARWEVERNGRAIRLPRKCQQLLQLLLEAPGRVVPRSECELAVWGAPLAGSDTLRAHMHTLRRALTAGGEDDPIETVHGVGYRLAKRDAA